MLLDQAFSSEEVTRRGPVLYPYPAEPAYYILVRQEHMGLSDLHPLLAASIVTSHTNLYDRVPLTTVFKMEKALLLIPSPADGRHTSYWAMSSIQLHCLYDSQAISLGTPSGYFVYLRVLCTPC